MKFSGYCFLLFLTFCNFQAFAQLQNANWFFGNGAGISFVTGSPVAVPGGQTNTVEGVATISRPNGSLLFYTDGMSVYNANHQQMPNGSGLNGGSSSSQSALIVPDPADTNLYYIFTVAESGFGSGLCYSKVDMTLQGGLGDVTVLNTQLVNPTDEKLTGVTNAAGDGYWVVAHSVSPGSNNYYAYPVTAAGVGALVTSTVGSSDGLYAGQMRISPAGNKIAHTLYQNSSVDLCDFDNATGVVSNALNIPLIGDNNGDYGVEFSASGNVLYCETGGTAPSPLFQINVNAGTAADIIASVTVIISPNEDYGTLYRAVDGKIYWAHYSKPYIGCINNPEVLGAGCNYVDDAVTLAPGDYSQHGLQNALPIMAVITPPTAYITGDTNLCSYDTLSLFANNDPGYWWSMLSNPNDTIGTGAVLNIYPPVSGYYILHGDSSNDTIQVIVNLPPAIDLGNDTSICSGHSITLDATNPSSTYNWNNSSTTATLVAATDGDYSVTVTNASGCTAADTTHLTLLSLPTVQIDDAVICSGSSVTLTATSGLSYEWQDGSTSQTFTATSTGTYVVTVTNANGCTASDAATVTALAPTVDLGNTIQICSDQQTTLNAGAGFDAYQWSNGSTNSSITVNQSGWYAVTVSLQTCPAYDSVEVIVIDYPVVNLGNDTTLCSMSSIVLNAGDNMSYQYLWSTLQTETSITVNQTGLYSVTVSNVICNTSDSITLGFVNCDLVFPNAFSPNGDGLNDFFKALYLAAPDNFELRIYNRWGQQVFTTTNLKSGWDGTYNKMPLEIGSYAWTCKYTILGKSQQASGSVTLIR